MSLQIIDKRKVNQFLSDALKDDTSGDNSNMQTKHFIKINSFTQEQISAIIQTNKLIQVISAMLINNQITKISHKISCNLFEFIASDYLNIFQYVFNDICLFYNKKTQVIKTVNLGEPDIRLKDIFCALKAADKLNPSLNNYFNWNHNFKAENLLLMENHVFYELEPSNPDYWHPEEIENVIFFDAILQKLVTDTYNFGAGSLTIAGWSTREITENESFLRLKQLFEKVFFHGIILNNNWISIELFVIDFSKRFKDYLNHDLFRRIM